VTGDYREQGTAGETAWWPAADDELCSACSEPAIVTDRSGVSYCWEHS
jgi:hypothetical protein